MGRAVVPQPLLQKMLMLCFIFLILQAALQSVTDLSFILLQSPFSGLCGKLCVCCFFLLLHSSVFHAFIKHCVTPYFY